jgi:choline dehydrogenase-like flavoprotein
MYDILIVGAGPAGCVLANRLSADGIRSIALIEAGPDYGPEMGKWPAALLDFNSVVVDSHDWGYVNANPAVDLTRARIIGGTSTVNGSLWIRGSAADYDGWAAMGNVGWSFDDLLPYFKRAENDPMGGDLHGQSGPVSVYRAPAEAWTPVDRAIVDATVALGFPLAGDLNGSRDQHPAVGPAPKNVANGMRLNAAFAYLMEARDRPNLALITDTLVDRVHFHDVRAAGVVTSAGERVSAREVILSSGSFGSPSILMRSGIGPAGELSALGIPATSDLPGVGQNLMDHPLVNGLLECEIAPGHEPAMATFSPIMIKARSSEIDREIDLHVYQGQVFNKESGRWNVWFSTSLQFARSKGHLRLRSRDPDVLAEVDHSWFSEPSDLEALCDGVEFVNRLVATPPLNEIVERIPEKSLQWTDRNDLRAKVRAQVGTTYHPSGTCKMGPSDDPTGVVDQEGQVYGVDGLRVVDASIFPTGPHGNLQFPIIAAAEKIADAIRGE